jgi:hypothetical protein
MRGRLKGVEMYNFGKNIVPPSSGKKASQETIFFEVTTFLVIPTDRIRYMMGSI